MSYKKEDFWDTETITITRKDLEDAIIKLSEDVKKITKDSLSGAWTVAIGFRIMLELFKECDEEK